MNNLTMRRKGKGGREGKFYIRSFTLTEVTISIAIISVGLVGIMGLFPIGLQATKDGIGDNYSSSMADQFLHLNELQCHIYNGKGIGTYGYSRTTGLGLDTDGDGTLDWDGWGEYITGTGRGARYAFPTAAPSADDYNNVYKGDPAFLPDSTGTIDYAGIYQGVDSDGRLATDPLTRALKYIYYVEAKSGSNVDWDGYMCLWKEKIGYDSNGDGEVNETEVDVDPFDGVIDDRIPYEYGARLCIELSWPAVKPYDKRRKRVYSYDLFSKDAR